MQKGQFQSYKRQVEDTVESVSSFSSGPIPTSRGFSFEKNRVHVRTSQMKGEPKRHSQAELRWHCGRLELRTKLKGQMGWTSMTKGPRALYNFEDVIGFSFSAVFGLDILIPTA